MSYEHILVDIEDGVGIITLNRPEKLNAMNRRLASEVHEAVQRLDADDAVGCIVLTGAGRAFSAGGDIHEQLEDDARYSDEELNRMRTRRGYLDVSMSKKPNIGMMNGLAFGGAGVVEAEEAYRIGLLNHLVPRAELRAKTMELARTIAGNNRAAVIGIKALMLKQMTQDLEAQWAEERRFTTEGGPNAKAKEAFPEFIARKGIALG